MLPTGTRVAILGGTLDGYYQLQSTQGVVIDPYHNKTNDFSHVHLDRPAIVDVFRTQFAWDVPVHDSQLVVLEAITPFTLTETEISETPVSEPTNVTETPVEVQESPVTESENTPTEPVPGVLEPVSLSESTDSQPVDNVDNTNQSEQTAEVPENNPVSPEQ